MTKSKKPRAKRKREEQLILDAEAVLAQRRARAAQKSLKDDPRLEGIFKIAKDSAKQATDAIKGLDENHPQNFANRRKGHTLWNEEIDAAEKLASAAQKPLKARALTVKNTVSQALIAASSDDWATVESLTDEAALLAVKSLPGSVSSLEKKFLTAQNARQDFTQAKKASSSE